MLYTDYNIFLLEKKSIKNNQLNININTFVLEKKNELNENMKNWLTTFLLLINLGVLSPRYSYAKPSEKQEILENIPKDKLDAAKFVDFLSKTSTDKSIDLLWNDFIQNDSTINSSLLDVKKYISQDGKKYYFDKKYQIHDYSNVDIHDINPTNYLTDLGNFIEDSDEPQINNFIYNYNKETQVEICIITIPSLDENQDIADYAQEQFHKIGIGNKGVDNGILLVFSKNDRKWRIHTGYGLEELLPDVRCKHIGDDIIVPYFKQGEYLQGMLSGLEEIKNNINKNPEVIHQQQQEIQKNNTEFFKNAAINVFEGAIILGLIFLFARFCDKRWSKSKETIKEIEDKLKDIEKLKKLLEKNNIGISNIDNLLDLFKKTFSQELKKMEKVDVPTKYSEFFKQDGKEKIKLLDNFLYSINSSYRNYKIENDRLVNIESGIGAMVSVVFLNSIIEKGINMSKELKDRYNTDINYNSEESKNKISKLEGLYTDIKNVYKTSFDKAEKLLYEYKNLENSIKNSIGPVSSEYTKYKSAEDKFNNFEKIISNSVTEMERYKSWSKSSEKDSIIEKINSFKKVKYSKDNLIEFSNKLDQLIDSINNMTKIWKRRKQEEEDKKRRQEEEEESSRRAAAAALASSYSSSSSFGGFSGSGDSGGGGASGSW